MNDNRLIYRSSAQPFSFDKLAKQARAETAFFRPRPDVSKHPHNRDLVNKVINETNKKIYGDAAQYIKPISRQQAVRDYNDFRDRYNNYWDEVRRRQKLDEEENKEIEKERQDTFGNLAPFTRTVINGVPLDLAKLTYSVKNAFNDMMSNKSSGGAEALESDNRDLLTKQQLKDDVVNYLKIKQQFDILKESLPQSTGKRRQEIESQLYEYKQYLENPENIQKISDFANARNREYGFWRQLGKAPRTVPTNMLEAALGYTGKAREEIYGNQDQAQKVADKFLIEDTINDLISKGRDSLVNKEGDAAYQADNYSLALAGLEAETKDDNNKIKENSQRASQLRMDEARYKQSVPKVWTEKSQVMQNESLWNPDYWRYCVPGTVGSSISSDNFWKSMAIKGVAGVTGATIGGLTGGWKGTVGGAISGWNAGSILSSPWDIKSGFDENKVEIHDKYLDNLSKKLDEKTVSDLFSNKPSMKDAILSDLQKQSMEYWSKKGMSDDYIKEHFDITNDEGKRNVLNDLASGRISSTSPLLKQCAMESALGLNAQYYSDNVVTMSDTFVDTWANWLPGGNTYKLAKVGGNMLYKGTGAKFVADKLAASKAGQWISKSASKAGKGINNHLFVNSEGRGVVMFDNAASRVSKQGSTITATEASEGKLANAFKSGYNKVGGAAEELGFGVAGKAIAGTAAGTGNVLIRAAKRAIPEKYQQFLDDFGKAAINKYQGVLDKIAPVGSWRRLASKYGYQFAKRRTVGAIAEGTEEGNQYQFSQKDFSNYRYGLPSLTDLLLGHTEATINAVKSYGSLFGICDSELKDDIEYWNNVKGGVALGMANIEAAIQSGTYSREAYQQHAINEALKQELVKNREDNKQARRSNQAISQQTANGRGDALISYLEEQKANDQRRRQDQRMASDEQWDDKIRTAIEIQALTDNKTLTRKLEAKGIKYGSEQYNAAIADYYNSKQQIKQNRDDIDDINNQISQNQSRKDILDIIRSTVEQEVSQQIKESGETVSDEQRKVIVENRVKERAAINVLYNKLQSLILLKAKANSIKGFFNTLKRRGVNMQQGYNTSIKLIDDQIKEIKDQINDLNNDRAGIENEEDRFDTFEGMSDSEIYNSISNSVGFIKNQDVQELSQQKTLLYMDNQQHLMHIDQLGYGIVERKQDKAGIINKIKNYFAGTQYEYNPEEYNQQQKDRLEIAKQTKEYSSKERDINSRINSKQQQINDLKKKDNDNWTGANVDAEEESKKINAKIADLEKDIKEDQIKLDNLRSTASESRKKIDERERLSTSKKSKDDNYVKRINKILDAQRRNDAIDWMTQDIAEGKAQDKIDELYTDEFLENQKQLEQESETTAADFARFESGLSEFSNKQEAENAKKEQEAARKKREEQLKQNGEKWNRRRQRVLRWAAKNLSKIKNKYKGNTYSTFGVTPEFLEQFATKMMTNGLTATYKIGNFIDDLRTTLQYSAKYKGLSDDDVNNELKENNSLIVRAYKKVRDKLSMGLQLAGINIDDMFSNDDELKSHLIQIPTEKQTLNNNSNWTKAQLDIKKRFDSDQAKIDKEKSDFYNTIVDGVLYENLLWKGLKSGSKDTKDQLENAKVIRSGILNYIITGDVKYLNSIMLTLKSGQQVPINTQRGFDQFIQSVTQIYNNIQAFGYMPLDVNLNVYGKAKDGSNVCGQADIVLIDRDGNIVIYNIVTSLYSNIRETGKTSLDLGTHNTLLGRAQAETQPIIDIFQSKYGCNVKAVKIIPISVYPGQSLQVENSIDISKDTNTSYNAAMNTIKLSLKQVVDMYNWAVQQYNYNAAQKIPFKSVNIESMSMQEIVNMIDTINLQTDDLYNQINQSTALKTQQNNQQTNQHHAPVPTPGVQYTQYEQDLIDAVVILDSMLSNIGDGQVDDNFIMQTIACWGYLCDLIVSPDTGTTIDKISQYHEVVANAIEKIALTAQLNAKSKSVVNDILNASKLTTDDTIKNDINFVSNIQKTLTLWNNIFGKILYGQSANYDQQTLSWYKALANNFIASLIEKQNFLISNSNFVNNTDPITYKLIKETVQNAKDLIQQFNDKYSNIEASMLIDVNGPQFLNSSDTTTRNMYSKMQVTSCQPSLKSMRQQKFREMSSQKDFTTNAKITFRTTNVNGRVSVIMHVEYKSESVDLDFDDSSKSDPTYAEKFAQYSFKFRNKVSKMVSYCQQHPEYHIETTIKKRRCSFKYDNKNGVKNVSEFLFNSEGNKHDLYTITVSSKDRIGVARRNGNSYMITDKDGNNGKSYADPDTGISAKNPQVGQLFYMYDDGRTEQHGKYSPVQLSVQTLGELGIVDNIYNIIHYVATRSNIEEGGKYNGYDAMDLINMIMFPLKRDASYQSSSNAISFPNENIVQIGSTVYNLADPNDQQQLKSALTKLRVCEDIDLLNSRLNTSQNKVFQQMTSEFTHSDINEITLPNGLKFKRDDFMSQQKGMTGSTYLGYLFRNGIIGTNAVAVDGRYIEVEYVTLVNSKDDTSNPSKAITNATSTVSVDSINSLLNNLKTTNNGGLNEIISPDQFVNRTDVEIEDYKRRASEVVRQMLGDGSVEELQFKNQAEIQAETGNPNIAGVCHTSYIALGTYAPESTVYHEAFHKILELTMPSTEREKLYQIYRSKYKNQALSERDVAEGLADMFTDYVQRNILDKNLKGFKYFYGWCKRIWFNIIMSIKFGNQWKTFKQLYSQMLRGKYKNAKVSKENIERFQSKFSDKLYYELENKQSRTITKYEHISNITEARNAAKSLAYLVIKANGLDTINPSGTKLELTESTPNKFNLIKSGLVSTLRADNVDESQKTDAQRLYSELLKEELKTIEKTDDKGNVVKREITVYPKFVPLIPLINQYISSISTGFTGRIKDIEDEQDSDIDSAVKDNIDKFDKASYEFNPLDQISDRVKLFFGTLSKIKFDENTNSYKFDITSKLGTPDFYDISNVFTTLSSEVHDLTSIEDLTKKLENMQDRDGMHRQVYRKWKQLCDKVNSDPNDTDLRQLQVAIAKSLKCHINNYVFCYSYRDPQGNLVSQIKNTEYDRDTVFAPMHWLKNLYNGNTGIFSQTRDIDGNITIAEGVNVNALKNISNLLSSIRSQLNVKTSIMSDDNIIQIAGTKLDLNITQHEEYVKKVFIALLNNIGIPINKEQLDYILTNRYGYSDSEALSMLMNSNGVDSMTPFLNILGDLITEEGKLNNKFAREGYTNCGFIKELANSIGQYNRSKQTSSRLGFDSKRYYQVSQNFAISQITDMINTHDATDDIYRSLLNSKYTMLVNKQGATIGSIFAKALIGNRNFKITLLSDIGSKTDRSDDMGNTYTNRTKQDDFMSKYSALRQGYILFPTLADKSSYVMLDVQNYGNSEISIPGLTFDTQYDNHGNRLLSVKTGPKIGYNSNIGLYIIPEDRVLDQMIEYAELEKARILEIMQECDYEDRKDIDGYEDNPNVKFVPKQYRVKNIHTGKGLRFQSLRNLVLEDGITEVNLSDENKSPAELMNLANKNFFNKTQDEKRQIMTMILARRNKDIIDYAMSIGIITIGDNSNVANNFYKLTRNVFDNLKNVALDNEEISALQKYFFENVPAFANETDINKIYYAKNLCRSLAIAALLGDAQNRHIIGTQELQRWYIGNPASFKNDADIQKRMGSLMSTGEDNIIYDGAPKYYNCAEVSDYVVGLTDKTQKEFDELFLKGELKETLANILISELQDKNKHNIKEIYDRVYSSDMTIDKIREEFKSLGDNAIEKMNKAEERAKKFGESYHKNNVADGQSYMSDKMCEQLLKFNGAWVGDVPRAFELIRKDNLTEKEYYEAYRLIQKAVNIVTVKYTAYGTRIHPITGEPITYLNKFAIAPIFKNIATGKMKDICQYMEDNNIDNLLFDSAVKIGSCNPTNFNGESFEHDLTIYQQPYATLRKQMNTDPEEGDEMHIGSQMVKVVLSNLIQGRMYKDANGNEISGSQILNDMMDSIEHLRQFGEKEFLDQFMTNGSVDNAKVSQWLTEQMGERNATEQLVSALSLKQSLDGSIHQTMPIAATASSKWIESIIISNANKNIVDIMTPGTSFVQRSVFAMEDENRKNGEGFIKSADSYNGQELKMINNKHSMDAIVSLDYFQDIIPKNIKTFKDARKWLIDNGIIGENAEANTIGYRIPTQAESSIHAIRILDVIDDVKGTVILPKAFTTVTGSDFDIDHLYLQRLNFKVDKKGKVIKNAYDSTQKEFYQNRLLNTMMTLLLDTDNSMHLLFKSIDNDTTLAQNCAKLIKSNNSRANQAYNFNTLSEQLSRKDTFISGKFGIGPYALNLTIQTLLEQFTQRLSDGSLPAKIKRDKIGNHFTDEGDTILAWLSAFINGNVDNVKDPWVARLNSNTTTFNMINFLLKLGYGKQAVWFCAQPIIKKLAEFESVKNCKLLQDPQNFKTQNEMLDQFLSDNIGMSLQEVEQKVKKINKYNSLLVNNTLENKLLQDVAIGDSKLSEKDLKTLQTNVILSWFALQPYAEQLSRLIQFSKIDTRKEGKTFAQLTAYKYGYQALYLDNFDHSITPNQIKANDMLMFNQDDLKNLRENTWIGPKTRSVINSIFDSMQNQVFIANRQFRNTIIRMAENLSQDCYKTGKISAKLIDDLTTGAISQIKFDWIYRYASQFMSNWLNNDNNNAINSLFIGDNSVAMMLDTIKSYILNNKEYKDIDGSIHNYNELKDNELLNRLRRSYDLSSDNSIASNFVEISRAFDDSKLDTDRLIESWEELMYSNNDFVRTFAYALAVYAMLTSCEYQGKNKLAKYIPAKFLSGELMDSKVDGQSFGEFIQDKLENGFDTLYLDTIVQNQINNSNFAKRKNEKDFEVVTQDGVTYLFSNHEYKDNEKAPRYITLKSKQLSATGRLTRDLYKLVEYNTVDNAVYLKINELGYHQKGFDIYNYNAQEINYDEYFAYNHQIDKTYSQNDPINNVQSDGQQHTDTQQDIQTDSSQQQEPGSQIGLELDEDGFIDINGGKFRLSSDKQVVEYTNVGDVYIRDNYGRSIKFSKQQFDKFVGIVQQWFDFNYITKPDGTTNTIKYNKDTNKVINTLIDGINGYITFNNDLYDAKRQLTEYNKSTGELTIKNQGLFNLYKFAESSLCYNLNKLSMTDSDGFKTRTIADVLHNIINGLNIDNSDIDSIKTLETGNSLFGDNDIDLLAKKLGIDKDLLKESLEEGYKKRKHCKGK